MIWLLSYTTSMSFEPVLSSDKDREKLNDKCKIQKKLKKYGLNGQFYIKQNEKTDGYKYSYYAVGERAEEIARCLTRIFPKVTFIGFVHYTEDEIETSRYYDFLFNRKYIQAIDFNDRDYIKLLPSNDEGFIKCNTDLPF